MRDSVPDPSAERPPGWGRPRVPLLLALLAGLALSLALLGAAASEPSLGAEEDAALEDESAPWLEEECEEGEGAECESGETEAFDPAECFVTSVRARVLVPARGERLRARVRYAAAEPITAYVALGLRGPAGMVDLGIEKRRLGRRGTFELRPYLSPARMDLSRRARYFVVTIEIPEAPAECAPLLTTRLSAKSRGPGTRVWAG